jgi:hypothetical protein
MVVFGFVADHPCDDAILKRLFGESTKNFKFFTENFKPGGEPSDFDGIKQFPRSLDEVLRVMLQRRDPLRAVVTVLIRAPVALAAQVFR